LLLLVSPFSFSLFNFILIMHLT